MTWCGVGSKDVKLKEAREEYKLLELRLMEAQQKNLTRKEAGDISIAEYAKARSQANQLQVQVANLSQQLRHAKETTSQLNLTDVINSQEVLFYALPLDICHIVDGQCQLLNKLSCQAIEYGPINFEAWLESHLMSCWMISLSTSATLSTWNQPCYEMDFLEVSDVLRYNTLYKILVDMLVLSYTNSIIATKIYRWLYPADQW